MNKLEIHYYLENSFHSMDAFVKNKAETELLKIFKEVSDSLDLGLAFEIEALEQGGIREFFRIINDKTFRKRHAVLIAYFGGIVSQILISVVTNKLNADNELQKLQKEELKLKIEKLKQELDKEEETHEESQTQVIINEIVVTLCENDKIKKHRSNFYAELLEEYKVEQFSTTELDERNNPISAENIIRRESFKDFVIEEFHLEPEIIENANIEVVSPVLKSGKLKWKGVYEGKSISFNVYDSEFKQAVINKEVHFANGTFITCTLEIEKTIDEEGNEKIKEYNIYDVLSVEEDNYQFITKKAKKIEADKRQLRISFDEDEPSA